MLRLESQKATVGSLWLLVVAFFLVACQPAPPRAVEIGGQTMGTFWSVKYLPPPGVDRHVLQTALEDTLVAINDQMSTYQPDSVISRFNSAEPGTSIRVPDAFADVMNASLRVAEASDGAFDPTIGPLVNIWGFGPQGRNTEPPSEAAVNAALARVGWSRLPWDAERQELTQPGGMYLDFSAIAKGYAVDRLASELRRRGVDDQLVNIGGDMLAVGKRPDGSAWRVGIERPAPDSDAGMRPTPLRVSDAAVVTSGNYRNFFQADGVYYSHTISAETGRPIPNDLVSVTVLHESAMMADAYATAIMTLGVERGLGFADEQALPVYLLVAEGDALVERFNERFEPFLERKQ